MKQPLTPRQIRELVTFDNGRFFWNERGSHWFANTMNERSWNGRWAGKEIYVRTDRDGYRWLRINNNCFLTHRLIWLFETGAWPTGQIDHINGNKSDNRIANLRDVSSSLNRMNQRMRSDNTSGFTGVCWHKSSGKWTAYVCVSGKRTGLGVFPDKSSAIQARKVAQAKMGFGPNHGRASA